MLAGESGEATALAMRILARMAPLYGAASLLTITRAHIDGCIYEGEAGLDFAEWLAARGGKVRVPTSLNVISLDRERWRALGLDADYADKARRLGEAYVAMGARPTFTCTPYHVADSTPAFAEQIAWAESNAVAYANTVLGARTNRYGDYLDISCALTGRVPAAGLHLGENRVATVLLRLIDLPVELPRQDSFYPVLGYLVGTLVDDEVAAIEGISAEPTGDQLKAFCAAAATSGSVALSHIVGVTPEAPTRADAFGHRPPRRTLDIDLAMLRDARRLLTTALPGPVDVVAFGSPHCSLAECGRLAALMRGRQASPGVEVFITTSRAIRTILELRGDLAVLEAFGAKVTADTCIVVSPLVKRDAQVLMTNSAKYAHYAPGLIGVQSVFGSTEDCVASAISGVVVVEEGPWAR